MSFLLPQTAQLAGDIHKLRKLWTRGCCRLCLGPGDLLELRQHSGGHEAALAAVHVRVAPARLLGHVLAQGRDEMQLAFGARHRHIEKPPLLFDEFGAAGGKLGWKASIRYIEDVNGVPLLAFR